MGRQRSSGRRRPLENGDSIEEASSDKGSQDGREFMDGSMLVAREVYGRGAERAE